MTKTKAIEEIKKLPSMTARTSGDAKEIRVNFKGGAEATAYYTTEPQDAIDTARLMAQAKPGETSAESGKTCEVKPSGFSSVMEFAEREGVFDKLAEKARKWHSGYEQADVLMSETLPISGAAFEELEAHTKQTDAAGGVTDAASFVIWLHGFANVIRKHAND